MQSVADQGAFQVADENDRSGVVGTDLGDFGADQPYWSHPAGATQRGPVASDAGPHLY